MKKSFTRTLGLAYGKCQCCSTPRKHGSNVPQLFETRALPFDKIEQMHHSVVRSVLSVKKPCLSHAKQLRSGTLHLERRKIIGARNSSENSCFHAIVLTGSM